MNSSSPINIVVASDNNYAILLAALLKSIEVNHHTAEPLAVYIIDDGISPRNVRRLQSQVDPSRTTLHWRKSSEAVPHDIKIPIDRSAFPITNYMRVFAPCILPEDTERFIYFDVDMIVLEDVSKLWHTDLLDKTIGAALDIVEVVSVPWSGIPNYKELGIPPDTKYFNSGLMVVDVRKWRDREITYKVMECTHTYLDAVNLADQYGLNVVLLHDWMELDRRWNNYSIWERKDPYVIHYLDIKPIFKSYNRNKDYQAEFYKYLRLTSWKNHRPVSDYMRVYWKVKNKGKKVIRGFFKN
jgi:lipopolysaccharide biosynthesis glycosyltransferase